MTLQFRLVVHPRISFNFCVFFLAFQMDEVVDCLVQHPDFGMVFVRLLEKNESTIIVGYFSSDDIEMSKTLSLKRYICDSDPADPNNLPRVSTEKKTGPKPEDNRGPIDTLTLDSQPMPSKYKPKFGGADGPVHSDMGDFEGATMMV